MKLEDKIRKRKGENVNMKLAQKTMLRMKNILKQDKEKLNLPLLNMIKSDIYEVINGYIEVRPEDIDLKYFIDDDGFYRFNIGVKSRRVKKINFLNI